MVIYVAIKKKFTQKNARNEKFSPFRPVIFFTVIKIKPHFWFTKIEEK